MAVPSRLYSTPSKQFPLAGLRISVKDVFHLKGVPTTNGNRAYARLYGEQHVSSAAVQDAIDKGAIIVGKTKTAEFAGSQEVEGDWADYSCPFNPRADGYLRSSGSSTGSASGVASYSWLDGSLGSDGILLKSPHPFFFFNFLFANVNAAGGSVRDPAVVHGVHGFRPSHDGSSEPNTSLPCVSVTPDEKDYLFCADLSFKDLSTIWLSCERCEDDLQSHIAWTPPSAYQTRGKIHLAKAYRLINIWIRLDARGE